MIDEDLEPLITRCPSCATQFRVTENQLAAAGGRVRCGACLTVFEGIQHLILDGDSTFSDGSEADAALDALLDELVNADGRRAGATPADVQPLSDAEFEPVEAPQLYGGFEDEPTQEIETLSEEAVAPASVDTSSVDEASVDETSVDESTAIDVEPEEEPGLEDEVRESPAIVASRSGTPETDSSDIQADYEAWIRPGIPNIDQLVEEVVASGLAPAAEAAPSDTQEAGEQAPDVAVAPVPAAAGAADGLRLSAVEKALAEEGVGISPVKFGPEPRRLWVPGGAAVLSLLLAGQILYLQLPEWSKDPGMRSFYQAVCDLAGCELPEIRAVDAFRTRNLMVRSHPDLQNALVIDAVIVNTAAFPQRYPHLELRFTSVGGLLVAGRTFAPEEYLAGEVRPGQLMPERTPVQVSIEIADPGDQAVNYTLSFH